MEIVQVIWSNNLRFFEVMYLASNLEVIFLFYLLRRVLPENSILHIGSNSVLPDLRGYPSGFLHYCSCSTTVFQLLSLSPFLSLHSPKRSNLKFSQLGLFGDVGCEGFEGCWQLKPAAQHPISCTSDLWCWRAGFCSSRGCQDNLRTSEGWPRDAGVVAEGCGHVGRFRPSI